MEAIDAAKENIYESLNRGTEKLHEAAMAKVKHVVADVQQAMMFLELYYDAAKHSAEHGQLPAGLEPEVIEAIKAIDALKEAQIDNIMDDPALSNSFEHDRLRASESYLVYGIPVEVVNDSLIGRV